MGYVLADGVSFKAFNAINSAIDVLENVDPRNVKPFMTAVVITSYVYNDVINFLESMRPVDDYDIMRWYLLFATIQKYNLDLDEIKTVRKNPKECFYFQNVPMYLPKINNELSLKVEEALALIAGTRILERTGDEGFPMISDSNRDFDRN